MKILLKSSLFLLLPLQLFAANPCEQHLDVFRAMKSYMGWTEGYCPEKADQACIVVAIDDQEQFQKTLEVFPETIELPDCRIDLKYWNRHWESGVTFHN